MQEASEYWKTQIFTCAEIVNFILIFQMIIILIQEFHTP